MIEATEIARVREPEFHVFLSEKFPPYEERGSSGVYYSAFVKPLV